MVSKKSSSRVAPKTSSATALTSSATTPILRSAILKSAFPSPQLDLSLFASVIQALDSQQVRVHDTSTGRIKCEYTPHRTKIHCLRWGWYGSSSVPNAPPAKKRRRTSDTSGSYGYNHRHAVIAIASRQPDIELFSPSTGKVIARLRDAQSQGTRDFRFKNDELSREAWSLGIDCTLIQWDLTRNEKLRSIATPSKSVAILSLLPTSILLGSDGIHILDPNSVKNPTFTPCFGTTIHSLISEPSSGNSSDPSLILAAAQDCRSVNVCGIRESTVLGNLQASNDVERLVSFDQPSSATGMLQSQVLAAVLKDGKVDLFNSPFSKWRLSGLDKADVKADRKSRVRKADATVEVKTSEKASAIAHILDVSFQRTELILAINEGASDVAFHRLPWSRNDGSLALTGLMTVIKAKTNAFGVQTMNGTKQVGHTQVDESRAVIVQGGNAVNGHSAEQEVIEISSAEEESSDSEFEDEITKTSDFPNAVAMVNGATRTESEKDIETNDNTEQVIKEEPSFGDIIRAKSIGTVDVTKDSSPEQDQAVVLAGAKKMDIVSSLSLGTILTQSLHTNDTTLLEKCFVVEDLQIVRATIERLHSGLAITLLQRLAERLFSRPGRAGSLLVWIQWTLVAHGGYLCSRRDLVQKLSSLHQVIGQRAATLQPLLSLKGKLDMLEAQVNLRKALQKRHSALPSHSNQDRADLIYVEGQEESSSEDEIMNSEIPDDEAHLSEDDDSANPNDLEIDRDAQMFDGDSDLEDSMEDDVSASDQESEDDDLEEDVDHNDVDSIDGDEGTEASGDSKTRRQQDRKKAP